MHVCVLMKSSNRRRWMLLSLARTVVRGTVAPGWEGEPTSMA